MEFSIIIPFYNSEEYIERAILSVLNQTYTCWEIIAVNDGSNDNSLSIVKEYAAKEKRIKVFNKENGGYASAISFGLSHISDNSDYFMMLGSDDEILPDLLSRLEEKIVENPHLDVIGFRTVKIIDGVRNVDKYSSFDKDVVETNTTIWSFYEKHPLLPKLFLTRDTSRLYSTQILRKYNVSYFGRYGIDSDALFSVMFCCYSSSFGCFPIDGYFWYCRPDSVSGSKISDIKKQDIYHVWLSFFAEIDKQNLKIPKSILNTYVWRLIKYYEWSLNGGLKRYYMNKKYKKYCKRFIQKYGKLAEIKYGHKIQIELCSPLLCTLILSILRRKK